MTKGRHTAEVHTGAGSTSVSAGAAGSKRRRPLSAAVVRDRFRSALEAVSHYEGEDDFADTLRQSLEVVRQAIDRFAVSPEGRGMLAISFNGGKDACVVLYLLLMVLAERDEVELLCTRGRDEGESKHLLAEGIKVIYFEKEEFPEMDDFMNETSETLGFEFRRYTVSYREGMEDLVKNHNVKGVIMGQRRGDPWTADMEHFTPSTPGWPEFTRINPALEWKFHHVWRFLRAAQLSYCCLYDQGYTSLGERGDTEKNLALLLPDGHYRPAYTLAEEHLERSPRSAKNCASGKNLASGRGSDRDASAIVHLTRQQSSWDEKWETWTPDGEEDVSDGSATNTRAGTAAAEGGVGTGAGTVKAVIVAPEVGGCVAASAPGSDAKERSGPAAGWVGSTARWLPATALVLAVLASVGFRRSGGSLKGN